MITWTMILVEGEWERQGEREIFYKLLFYSHFTWYLLPNVTGEINETEFMEHEKTNSENSPI